MTLIQHQDSPRYIRLHPDDNVGAVSYTHLTLPTTPYV